MASCKREVAKPFLQCLTGSQHMCSSALFGRASHTKHLPQFVVFPALYPCKKWLSKMSATRVVET
eukprot:12025548-Karenia_brevis.AAC.1